MTRRQQSIFFVAFLLVSLAPRPAFADERITVQLPAGATVRYSIPPHPYPVVILLAGGSGVLALASQGWATQLQGNFLIRARDHFRANDLHVVMLDAPSHRLSGGLNNNRLTAEHASVLGAVIGDVRKRFAGRPVWLIGTSTGTLSAANAAARLGPPPAGPDGLVLTSAVTETGASGEQQSIFAPEPGYSLGAIRVSTLVVWHRDDSCPRSPGPAVGGNPQRILAELTKLKAFDASPFTPVKAGREFTGGISVGDPCEAFAHHGFNGIEDDVARVIAAFIKDHLQLALVLDTPPSRK